MKVYVVLSIAFILGLGFFSVTQVNRAKSAEIYNRQLVQQNADLLQSNSQLNAQVSSLTGTVEQLKTKLDNTLPYIGAKGQPIRLINQDNVRNPTWNELKLFLANDNTDKLLYIDGVRTCGDFAEILHNNAESGGLRSALVVINFSDGSTAHAANAFYTSDAGLVFVSSQGGETVDTCVWDMVVYLEKGKEFGSIPIDFAKSFDYQFYQNYKDQWDSYTILLTAYNNDVLKYNAFVKYPLNPSDYAKGEVWSKQLESRGIELNNLRDNFSKCFTIPMGIISDYGVYW
jgi:Rad3-related DNA helicase